jgi:hypothetical protein
VGLEVERAELVQAHDRIRVAGLGVLGAVHQGVQVQDPVLLGLIVRVAGPFPGLQALKGLGVLRLSEPVTLPEYGQLPTQGLLDELYREDKQQPYTAVGYGLEGSGPKTSFGGDTRRRAELRLVNLNGVLGTGKGVSAKFSSNANTGGTCFGDSGGPIFVSGTTTLVAVVSFGTSSTCSGTSGAYRLDQADDLAFLATFGITPP